MEGGVLFEEIDGLAVWVKVFGFEARVELAETVGDALGDILLSSIL
jgi:hypothetical protein